MSRHGYVDDYEDETSPNLWMGAVARAIRGRRGQAFLKELRDALDAMPEKRLISESLVDEYGARCALGAVAAYRGMDVERVDPEDAEQVAKVFGISTALAREITYENDECWGEGDERWTYMRRWVERKIISENKT
jgi:hypothetical protein